MSQLPQLVDLPLRISFEVPLSVRQIDDRWTYIYIYYKYISVLLKNKKPLGLGTKRVLDISTQK